MPTTLSTTRKMIHVIHTRRVKADPKWNPFLHEGQKDPGIRHIGFFVKETEDLIILSMTDQETFPCSLCSYVHKSRIIRTAMCNIDTFINPVAC